MEHFSITLDIDGLDSTTALGQALAKSLSGSTTLGLIGTLGAGKTYLAQAIAVACGVPSSAATSPTFVLCQVYHADRTIYHLDAYRMADEDEFIELGVEEMFASEALTLVEWADRVESVLPRDRITIEMEIAGSDTRRVTLTAPLDQKPTLLEIQATWLTKCST
jgi:tRNA threonylcarbamoyladenosine biosynthesis protein TsaE